MAYGWDVNWEWYSAYSSRKEIIVEDNKLWSFGCEQIGFFNTDKPHYPDHCILRNACCRKYYRCINVYGQIYETNELRFIQCIHRQICCCSQGTIIYNEKTHSHHWKLLCDDRFPFEDYVKMMKSIYRLHPDLKKVIPSYITGFDFL